MALISWGRRRGTGFAIRVMTTATAAVERNVGLRGGGAVELEPEAVLPAQYFANAAIDASLQPEKRLMLAVLEDAVGTFQKYATARERMAQRLFDEVEDWFSSDDLDWPYSFVNISHALGLDVGYLRAGLTRWREQKIRSGATSNVVRFPFRRVNGSRHMITGRAAGLKRSA
jgi:hypothetical protein